MSDTKETELPPAKKPKLEQSEETAIDFTEDVIDTGDKFSISDDKYKNYVTPEELKKLREFQVLDEVKSNDEDSNDEGSESSEGKSEGVPEEEIEKMLEEDLSEGFKRAPKPKEKAYVTRQKIVLEEKGVNHFEVLPLDWMIVRHYSGMPVYMHRSTRVCTLAKPYFLGKGNTRRHDIPISAIPCLSYRRALEEERKQNEIDKKIQEQIKNGIWPKYTNNNISENATSCNNKELDKDSKSDNCSQSDDKKDTVDNINNDHEIDKTNKLKCPFKHSNNSTDNDKIEQVSKEHKNEVEINDQYIIKNMEKDVTKYPFKNNVDEISLGHSTDEQLQSSSHGDIDTVKNIREQTIESCGQAHIIDKKLSDNNLEKSSDQNQVIFEKSASENLTKESSDADNSSQVIHEKKYDCPTGPLTDQSRTDGVEKPSDQTNEQFDVPLNRMPVMLPGGILMPPPRVETVNTSWKTQHLTCEQVNEYCKKLFVFKTVNIMHFKRWLDRRKYTKARKTLQYPTLPEGTKLITIPAQATAGQENGGKANKRDWVMNMNERSYLSVFHEYVRRALQKQPVYEFKQLENASSPYQATVYIGGMQYGVGHGSSKRQAKSAAARAAIHILIPEMKDDLRPPTETTTGADANEPDFSFFDYVGIEDPRISEFCAATCEPSPHATLRTCLLRNFGAGDRHIHTEMKKLEYQKIELTMKVGKHTATVVCKNKKTAKQRASQSILQALHPHVRSWGSLLRLYGSRSVKSCKEKKLEEQQITLLQDKARHNEPNYAVLEKLRNEMRRLRERDEAVVPIGTLLVEDELPTHSGSNLNNVDL